MDKEQNIRAAYVKPEIKTVHVLMDSMLLEASYPGDHKKGDHKKGPEEASSEGAKRSFFCYDEDGALGKDWED